MKTPGILTTTIAALLLAPSLFAVTDTWDGNPPGGSGDSLISNGLNWADNTAPLSDLANTDLIFAGNVKLSPDFSTAFCAKLVTFAAAASVFTLDSSTTSALSIGTGGIVNSSTAAQTIRNTVTLGAAMATFNAGSGPLSFSRTVDLGTNALSVIGTGNTSFTDFNGTGSVTKSGAGTMTWAPSANVSADITVSAGLLTTVSDGSTDVLSGTASLAVNGTGSLTIFTTMVLDSGAQMTRQGGSFFLYYGRTLTIRNGSDFIITGDHNSIGGTVIVIGLGSTMQTLAGGGLTISTGQTYKVQSVGSLSMAGGLLIGQGVLRR